MIDKMSSPNFEPERYADEYRERALAMIEKKVEGQEITLAEPQETGGQVIDLMEALRASLEKKAPARGKTQAPTASTAAERKPPKRAPQEEAPALPAAE